MARFCTYPLDPIYGQLASQAAYEGSIPFARSRFPDKWLHPRQLERLALAGGALIGTQEIFRRQIRTWADHRAIKRQCD
jgi:hypothetical protein